MADRDNKALRLRHRSRMHQVPIFLGKLVRSFVYMSDWKMIPMAAIIAAMVSMVVRKDYFLTMEGTLKGSFALTCVAIWNGCFNSIQVICRERSIIKREHRSGMHVSAYIFSHMIYQAFLCLAQSVTTVLVCSLCGVKFPAEGTVTPLLMLDFSITLFFISFASDMVSLLVSSIAHSTTAAMTVMPFVLIFQLVFSGGIFNLPAWAQNISNFTISNYGFKCLNAQADYNERPMVTGWSTLVKVQDQDIDVSFTLGEVIDTLHKGEQPAIKTLRETPIQLPDTGSAEVDAVADYVSDLLTDKDGKPLTVGALIDLAAESPTLAQYRDRQVSFSFKIGDVMDVIGRAKLQSYIQERTAATMYNADYVCSRDNIIDYWTILVLFAIVFSAASVIVLEFIDKDKR